MLDKMLTAAAQVGGVPAGWSNDDLAELAARHYMLSLHAKTEERRLWHLRQRTMLCDLLETQPG